MASYNNVLVNYQSINQKFNQLRTYLIYQLNKCYVTDVNDYNFTELIEAVEQIRATEYHNSNNIRPNHEPQIDNTNLTTYNKTLYLKIRYYMRLMAYFLVLKGVPNTEVAKQNDLLGLISLIDMITVKAPTTLSVQNITQDYYYGEAIILDYTVLDINGNNVNEGEITIESEGIIYDSIEVGQQIIFTPLNPSTKVNNQYQSIPFTFTYHGSDNYDDSYPITKHIIVRPSRPTIHFTAINDNDKSKYHLNEHIGYETDTWKMELNITNAQGSELVDVPILILIDGTTVVDDVTDEHGYYLLTQNLAVGNHTIVVSTNYDVSDEMTNVDIEYLMTIKYNPLYQTQSDHQDYLGKNSYQYEVIIRNENTGATYDDSLISNKNATISLDGQILGTASISQGKITYTLPNAYVNIGDHILHWNIDGNQIHTNIKFYSNFILPSTNKFYVNDTPDIIYAPLISEHYGTNQWSPAQNKSVNVSLTYTRIIDVSIDEITGEEVVQTSIEQENFTSATNAQGILENIKNYQNIGQYELTLTSASDNLNETVTYTYEEAESYTLEVIEYSKRPPFSAEVQVEVYNDDFLGIQSFLVDSSNNTIQGTQRPYQNNNILNFYYSSGINEGEYTHILKLNNNIINNDIHFNFIANPIVLLTSSAEIGSNTLEFLCNDNSIEDITLESDYIITNEITKTNNKFYVDVTCIQAGNISFTINTEDESIPFTITVNKGTLHPSILIQKITPNGQTQTIYNPDTDEEEEITVDLIEEVNECIYSEVDTIKVFLLFDDEIVEDINVTYVFNNTNIETYTFVKEKVSTEEVDENASDTPVNDETEDKHFSIPNLSPNTYTLSFIFNGSVNYNAFNISDTFTILRAEPTHQITDNYSVYTNNNITESSLLFDINEKYYQSNSVNNNIGHYKYDIWYETEDNVKVSCTVKQTSADNWYSVGLSIIWGEPILETTTNTNNSKYILLAGSYNPSNHGAHKQRVAGLTSDLDMIYNKEYKLEVIRINNNFSCKIIDVETNEITLSNEYTYTGAETLNKWGFVMFEGAKFYCKNIEIIKLG